MKEEMSSVDIRYIVRELQWLVGSRVDKVYHDGDEVRFKLRTKEGRADLILEAGKRFHLTSYIKEAPKQPSSFTMLLRKHLGGGFIDAIEQHQFDRIVKIRIGNYTLIGELFRRGNIILVDSENKIVAALRYEEYKDRAIKPKAEYKFPPARENPLEVSFERFLDLMREEPELELVRALARKLNMGGMYAEEISLRAGFEKTTPVKELSDEDLKRVYDEMIRTFNDEPKPNIVFKDGVMHDVVPIELKIYEGFEKRYFPTFSEALDEYFGKITLEKAKIEQTKKLEEKKRGLMATLRKQEEMLKGFEKAMRENQEIGDLIYANYTLIERLLEEFRKATETLGWDEFRRRIDEGKKTGNKVALMVKGIDPKEKAVTIELDGKKVKLYLEKSLGENAEIYYEKAKKFRHKYEGALKAYEDTKRKLEEIEKLIEEEQKKELNVKKLERRKRKWFEKFRWFVSSEGFLVLAGKDASTNEVLVKKHMEDNDLYCHADVYGAPHVVIKDGQKAGEKTIFEACQFAVSMSRAWSQGLYSADAYWAYPNQVTKQAPSGEYLGKGAFMVYGKRNWMHGLPLKLAVGVINYDGEEYVVCAPVEAIKAHTDKYIVIRPGSMKKGELVKKLRGILKKWGYEVREEDLNAILPPGGGEIVEVVG
ncbi:predicted fibronectin-binding protein [Thermococcus kodakarensis KOD1]|uniref:Archaeal Rqc2 homolog aRqcH n=1 Tax=Thermococcus kodakarensis (strain ATCC BAA-918 / JCM 12380 / KOD1) TaxID=69014 RepID=Q5JDJ5_THEKO|nr:ribosome rescue protein RqcH [Thermococcus kodakarensis]WCN27409.1 ribosome rescue protein RqcH [Thermococcus kodakarensis]WCN29699.1 ribosome rescue protein RqcH [Thermococcus kodakarensis]BAD85627.1 predicted fibronectin-binding protein [Thermococcus kodakarensis KOD1]